MNTAYLQHTLFTLWSSSPEIV